MIGHDGCKDVVCVSERARDDMGLGLGSMLPSLPKSSLKTQNVVLMRFLDSHL